MFFLAFIDRLFNMLYNIYKDSFCYPMLDMIGGNNMKWFKREQYGLWQTRFWCTPQSWRGRNKIILVDA